MIYLTFGAIAVFFFFVLPRDRDAFFSCLVRIDVFFVTFPASRLILVKAVDRFSAVFSAFVKSFL
jgi:hypothetical protein